MRKLGWYDKRGVTILEGKWQNWIESEEVVAVGGFDVVYTDTFSEDYQGSSCLILSLEWECSDAVLVWHWCRSKGFL